MTTPTASDAIVAMVMADFGFEVDQFSLNNRDTALSAARSAAIYTLRLHGVTYQEVFGLIDMAPSSISASLKRARDGNYDWYIAKNIKRKDRRVKTVNEYALWVCDRLEGIDGSKPVPINPLVMNKLVCTNVQISNDDLLRGSKSHPNSFARQILIYIYRHHARFTHAGAAQCLCKSSESSVADATRAVNSGVLDNRAKEYMPSCNGAKDYARIMFKRCMAKKLPKHRRPVAS